jgi:hypothetical protein
VVELHLGDRLDVLMSAPAKVAAECLDCAALPTLHQAIAEAADRDHLAGGKDWRPSSPRPIAPGSSPRRPRCATHLRAHKRAVKARNHATRVQRVYGLADGEYDRLYAAQGGTCAFPRCRATGKVKRLAVDHDHETGEVRGLLCGPHNYQLVGKFAGDLEDAIAYLADPPARATLGAPVPVDADQLAALEADYAAEAARA